jgi:hypothetical protein
LRGSATAGGSEAGRRSNTAGSGGGYADEPDPEGETQHRGSVAADTESGEDELTARRRPCSVGEAAEQRRTTLREVLDQGM